MRRAVARSTDSPKSLRRPAPVPDPADTSTYRSGARSHERFRNESTSDEADSSGGRAQTCLLQAGNCTRHAHEAAEPRKPELPRLESQATRSRPETHRVLAAQPEIFRIVPAAPARIYPRCAET